MSKKKKGIKLLITGLANSAKSSTCAKLAKDETYVINCDYNKAYPFNMLHTTVYPHDYFDDVVKYEIKDGKYVMKGKNKVVDKVATAKARQEEVGNSIMFNGFKKLKNELTLKMLKYRKVYGKLPRTVVLDTATGYYGIMQKYTEYLHRNNNNTFAVHASNIEEINGLNDLLDTVFLNNGINVIIVAHVTFDEKLDSYIIKTSGQFDKNGSFLSVVDNAIFLSIDGDERVVHHKTLGLPCRTTLYDELPELEGLSSYDINKHIEMIEGIQSVAEEF
jgi:ASC-1-like (ASCH) protein